MTSRQGMQKRCLVFPERKVVDIFQEFPESVSISFQTPNPEDVQSVFSQRASLVKAANVNLPCHINPARRDAVDAELPQTTDRKTRPY